MKKLLPYIIASSIAAIGSTCFAENFYAGIGAGRTSFDNDLCNDVEAIPGVGPGSCDDSDTAWKLFGGYQFNKNIAVEISYIDLGDFSFDNTVIDIDADVDAFAIDAVGILPLNDMFSLHGRAGIARWDLNGDSNILGTTVDFDDNGTDFHYGLGGTFNVTEQIGIRAEWERIEDVDADIYTANVAFNF